MLSMTMAMLLTGAGDVQRTPAPGSPPPTMVIIPPAPPLPVPRMAPPPAPPPPPPARVVPPQRVQPNLSLLFSTDDYPAAALRNEEEGTVRFQLVIGPDGRVSRCEVTASSGSAALDSASCRILTARARYRPARDPQGSPIAGSDSGRVTWRLPLDNEEGRAGVPMPHQSAFRLFNFRTLISPGDYPASAFRARASGTSAVRVAIGTEGRVVACAVEEGSGSTALDLAACRIVSARARYSPARDAAGDPRCDIDLVRVRWQLPASRPAWATAGPIEGVTRTLSSQLNATLCPGWTEPPPEEDTPAGLPIPRPQQPRPA